MDDYDLVSYEALGTDRHNQWNRLQEAWKDPRHLVILLPGDREQFPELFVKRIWHWLEAGDRKQIPQGCGEYHADGKAGWERCLRLAFGDPALPTPTILQGALSGGPLFLPIASPTLGPGVIDDVARDGLLDFLREGLPAVLPVPPGTSLKRPGLWCRLFRKTPSIPHCAHPLRLLVTVRPEWNSLFQKALKRRERQEILNACFLTPLPFPTWEDIEDLLVNRIPSPSDKTCEAIKLWYHTRENDDYRALVEMLHEKLR